MEGLGFFFLCLFFCGATQGKCRPKVANCRQSVPQHALERWSETTTGNWSLVTPIVEVSPPTPSTLGIPHSFPPARLTSPSVTHDALQPTPAPLLSSQTACQNILAFSETAVESDPPGPNTHPELKGCVALLPALVQMTSPIPVLDPDSTTAKLLSDIPLELLHNILLFTSSRHALLLSQVGRDSPSTSLFPPPSDKQEHAQGPDRARQRHLLARDGVPIPRSATPALCAQLFSFLSTCRDSGERGRGCGLSRGMQKGCLRSVGLFLLPLP